MYSAFLPGVLKGQKTVLYTPELELQTVVGYHMGARTEHGSFEGATNAHNCLTISLALKYSFLKRQIDNSNK